MADSAAPQDSKSWMDWYRTQYERLNQQASLMDVRSKQLDERQSMLYEREKKMWQWQDDLTTREQELGRLVRDRFSRPPPRDNRDRYRGDNRDNRGDNRDARDNRCDNRDARDNRTDNRYNNNNQPPRGYNNDRNRPQDRDREREPPPKRSRSRSPVNVFRDRHRDAYYHQDQPPVPAAQAPRPKSPTVSWYDQTVQQGSTEAQCVSDNPLSPNFNYEPDTSNLMKAANQLGATISQTTK